MSVPEMVTFVKGKMVDDWGMPLDLLDKAALFNYEIDSSDSEPPGCFSKLKLLTYHVQAISFGCCQTTVSSFAACTEISQS